MPKSPRVMIASPTPGYVKTAYMRSVMATMNDLGKSNTYAEWQTFESIGDLVIARNTLATRFLSRQDLTHLVMADSDMAWPGDLIRKMIQRRKPVIAAGYSKRNIDMTRFADAVRAGLDTQDAFLLACDWVSLFKPGLRKIEYTDGLIRVERFGLGLAVIERAVLETMVVNHSAPLQEVETGEAFHNFFTPRPSTISRQISEDRAFCERWTNDCGGELWVYADAAVSHIGEFAYGGSYLQYLHALQTAQEKTNP